ncbi:MAG: hypothetical protein ACLTA5_02045 [Anaerococcus obesiensis]
METLKAGVMPHYFLYYDNFGNIINEQGEVLYYAKSNVINDNNDFTLSADEATLMKMKIS